MKKRYTKTLITFIIITFIVSIFSTNLVEFTYASKEYEDVDCKLTISGYKQFSIEGDIFNTPEKWYPGYSKNGVVEILNNFGKVTIEHLGLKVKSIDKSEALDDFNKYFKLSVERVKVSGLGVNFIENLVDSVSFKDMIDNGQSIKNMTSYKSDSTYLRYVIEMDEDAPNSLMNISADIEFVIGIEGYENDKPKKKKEEKHWAHDCIETLLKYGIIQGYPDGTIQPDDNITRAEAAVLIANALNIMPDDTSPYPYQDKSHPWYRGHVISGSKEDVVRGYLDGTFKPSKYINREEMTAMLIRGFEKKASESRNLSFVDSQKIADWAVEYVRAAAEHKVIEGYPDETFRPQRNITRGEAFTIICKLLGLHHLHEVK